MMSQEDDYKKYFEVLELSPGASLTEVRDAYNHLRHLYTSDSYVLSPLEDELPDDWKNEVVERIEDAYAKLSELFGKKHKEGIKGPLMHNDALRTEIENIKAFNGKAIQQVRKKLGVDLHELSRATKISLFYLEKIEEEMFSAFPGKVYLRGYVKNIAKHLSLDPEKVANDYMSLYTAWEKSGGNQ